jgi:hypothetical protein
MRWILALSLLWQADSLFGARHHAPKTRQLALTLRAGESSPLTGPVVEYSDEESPPTRALIFMDCFCRYHGVYMASRALEYKGVAVVFCLSDYLRGYLMATEPDDRDRWEAARMPTTLEEVDEWKRRLGGVELVGLFCESDSGLADAELGRSRLAVTCQDEPAILEARRNKYLMNEMVGKSGLQVVKQCLCQSKEQAQTFAKELLSTSGRVVVKPIRGVASESVYLCEDLDQVKDAWNNITSTNVFGTQEQHSSCLVQEFLDGTEYALDVVSRDGSHKVAAIWKYDKRPANGAAFCYFKTELIDSACDPACQAIVEYTNKALSALGVRVSRCFVSRCSTSFSQSWRVLLLALLVVGFESYRSDSSEQKASLGRGQLPPTQYGLCSAHNGVYWIQCIGYDTRCFSREP